MDDFPNDTDGDAMRRIQSSGSDFSKPMMIDFQVAIPDKEKAETFAERAYKLGYRISIYESPSCSLPWTVECTTRMLVTYEALILLQDELHVHAKDLGGYPDGWGTLGNVEE